LLDAVDKMKFDKGETEMWVTERGNGRLSDKILLPDE